MWPPLVCHNTYCKIPHVTHCRCVRGRCRSSVFCSVECFQIKKCTVILVTLFICTTASCRDDTARHSTARREATLARACLRCGTPISTWWSLQCPSHCTSDHTMLPILPPASHSPTPGSHGHRSSSSASPGNSFIIRPSLRLPQSPMLSPELDYVPAVFSSHYHFRGFR